MTENSRRRSQGQDPADFEAGSVRIVGGTFRGRKLPYSGDPRTRPMKDRVRESVFNLLPYDLAGVLALDLFAGTGVLGFEALSRGAERFLCLEQHIPTARLIEQNAVLLETSDRVSVVTANTFLWVRRLAEGKLPPSELAALAAGRWLVFCSPPYAFYVDRAAEMRELLARLIDAAPAGSHFIVEADEHWDFAVQPQLEPWDIRTYPPAVIGLADKR